MLTTSWQAGCCASASASACMLLRRSSRYMLAGGLCRLTTRTNHTARTMHSWGTKARHQHAPDAQGSLEVVIGHRHGVEDLGINVLILQVDDVHLLANALQGSLRAQRCQVGSHIAVCVLEQCVYELRIG